MGVKVFCLLLICISLSVDTAYASHSLSNDFIVGFESGIFVRDDEKAFDDYSCERPHIEKGFIHTINSYVAPMKLMAGMS